MIGIINTINALGFESVDVNCFRKIITKVSYITITIEHQSIIIQYECLFEKDKLIKTQNNISKDIFHNINIKYKDYLIYEINKLIFIAHQQYLYNKE
jgi:hypothetical protein